MAERSAHDDAVDIRPEVEAALARQAAAHGRAVEALAGAEKRKLDGTKSLREVFEAGDGRMTLTSVAILPPGVRLTCHERLSARYQHSFGTDPLSPRAARRRLGLRKRSTIALLDWCPDFTDASCRSLIP